jgi:hypothetical protein
MKETTVTVLRHPNFLRAVLLADAGTCVATGLLMSAAAGPVAALTQIPAGLLFDAGLSLFPIAAFIAWVGTRRSLPTLGVWLVVLGNLGWVAGSLWLLAGGVIGPNAFGIAFIAVQAAAVATLAGLEYLGLRHLAPDMA